MRHGLKKKYKNTCSRETLLEHDEKSKEKRGREKKYMDMFSK
jgi:hypothetical protein